MHDTACEEGGYQKKRQPPFPPLLENDQEHAEVNPDDDNVDKDLGARAPASDQRFYYRRYDQSCQ